MMLPFFDGHCHIVSALTLARIILILQAASSPRAGKNSIFNMLKYLHLHPVDLGGNCNCD